MAPLWAPIQEEMMAVRPRCSADWQSAVSRIGNPLTVAIRHDSNLCKINHFQQVFLERRTGECTPTVRLPSAATAAALGWSFICVHLCPSVANISAFLRILSNRLSDFWYVLLFLALCGNVFAAEEKTAVQPIVPPPPAREFRAAWIATVANIDWPSKPGLPVAQQQAELNSLLDRAAQLHFNAVFFQVRTVSDALYASTIEPWSEYLTGTQGRAPEPFYDPLAFAVTGAHQRGLELHAWFNPFRAGHPLAKSPPAPNHITRLLPELVRHYGDQTVLDPGEPPAQARALAVMLDVVKRYDVDGVVIDDYFYPYPQKDTLGVYRDFPDDVSWARFGAASGLSRADWRRDNINRFIFKLSQSIKTAKPWVQFGVSPFGIWRPKNPPPIAGLDAYEKIYADSRKWLAVGWVDYLAPQLYWAVASPEQSFPLLFDWWRAQNVKGRHVWPALADSNVGTKFLTAEIPHQIQLLRQKNDPGAVHYHLRSVLDNPALAAAVGAQYSPPALVPTSLWLNFTSPPPAKLSVYFQGKSAHVVWRANPNWPAGWWLLQVRTNGAWTTRIIPGPRTEAYVDNLSPDALALRAVNRLGNLSAPLFWTPTKYTAPDTARGIKK